jgi:hypothetical protein
MAETSTQGPVLPPTEALEQMREAARAISARARLATAAVAERREGRDALRRDFDPRTPDPSSIPTVSDPIADRVIGPEINLPREELAMLLEQFQGQGANTPAGHQSIVRRAASRGGGSAGGGSGFGGGGVGGGMRDPGVATTTAGSPPPGTTVQTFGSQREQDPLDPTPEPPLAQVQPEERWFSYQPGAGWEVIEYDPSRTSAWRARRRT